MGRAGKQKTPTKELAARGSWHAKKPERRNELVARRLPSSTQPPAYLSPEAADIWREYAEASISEGVLTILDVPTFGMMCETIAEYNAARDQVLAEGISVIIRKQPALNPAVKVRDEASARALRYFRELGLTPPSRIGLPVTKPTQATDPDEVKIFAKE